MMQIIQKQFIAIFIFSITVLDAQFALPIFQAFHKPHNYVIDMDGSNDYVSVASNTAFEPDAFTIQTWVNLDAEAGGTTRYFVYRHKTWYIGMTSGGATFIGAVRDNNSSNWQEPESTTNPDPDGGWYHIVLTFASSVSRLYVNGSQENVVSSSGYATNEQTTPVSIGAKYNDGDSNNYDGQIDNVAFWNEALTANEITALYNSGSPLDASSISGNYTSSSGLVSYYKFNKNANSETGSYNGSASGGPTYVDISIP